MDIYSDTIYNNSQNISILFKKKNTLETHIQHFKSDTEKFLFNRFDR